MPLLRISSTKGILKGRKTGGKNHTDGNKTIPSDIDYEHVHALKKEAVIKLGNIRPATIGQASRIPGITPADIALLLVHLQKRSRQQT